MAQAQLQIDVIFVGGANARGVATGNNATWRCQCGYAQWLIGNSFDRPVVCPACQRTYFVIPDGPPGAKVLRVEER